MIDWPYCLGAWDGRVHHDESRGWMEETCSPNGMEVKDREEIKSSPSPLWNLL